MATRAKSFEYADSIDEDGAGQAEGEAELKFPDAWTPEHLMLAGLVRCTLKSLSYHAGRAGITIFGGGSASGVVTRR